MSERAAPTTAPEQAAPETPATPAGNPSQPAAPAAAAAGGNPPPPVAGGAAPAAPEVPAPEVKPQESAAQRFARLAAEKNAIRKQKLELKPLQEKARAFEEARANAKKDPLAALKALDLDPEAVIQAVLVASGGAPAKPEDKVSALEKRLDEKERLEKEAKQREENERYENARKQVRDTAKNMAASDRKRWSFAGHPKYSSDAAELAENYVRATWAKTGNVIGLDKALDRVDAYMREYFEGAREILAPAPATATPPAAPAADPKQPAAPEAPAKPGLKTLDSTLTPAMEGKTPPGKKLSDAERRARALDKLKWL